MRRIAYAALVAALSLSAQSTGNVGLSLFFQNGVMPPVTFYGNPPRYLQELDISTKSVTSTTDLGIEPLKQTGDLANLNWTGIKQVEEEWKPVNGKYNRVRYYRGAQWMTQRSTFTITPLDAGGIPIGAAITADAGWDDRINEGSDDAWVRRFTARQTAAGCPAINNCTGATYTAQGVVSFRDALNPNARAKLLPANTATLEVRWSVSNFVYKVAVNHSPATALPYGYGFSPALESVTAPANGQFYQPGDTLRYRIVLKDGAGKRLHPIGSLPTYAQVTSGTDTSGIRYYNPNLNPQLYYAFKHREANGLVTVGGPTHLMTTSKLLTTDSYAPQVVTANVATSGFTALVVGYPPLSVTRNGGPADTPVSDIVEFKLPTDALPGTYVVALKARREFGGEAINRGAMLTIQVGSTVKTGPSPKFRCNDCHEGRSSFSSILHGLPDTRPCAACHTASTFIGAFDNRVHTIHDRSNRFDENVTECRVCHTSTPTAPANGIVIHTGSSSTRKRD